MEQPTNTMQLSLAYKLFKDMQQDNLEYTYRGNFSTSITDNILSLAETNLQDEDKIRIKKRVYFIMVEGLQNITRHQTEVEGDVAHKPGLFVIQRKKYSYYITTGNLMLAKNVARLKSQMEKINSLEPDELKKYYREMLEAGSISDKGGAGLGLIEIARKSGTKLVFDFHEVNENYSFFYLLTEIPFTLKPSNANEVIESNILATIKDLHHILDEYNILLNFSGIFNQDNLINLLTIIERQMKGTVILKMKVFNIMVEMLQNIVRHADNYKFGDVEGNYGIFFIAEKDDEFLLTSGNYIQNQKIAKLEERLDYVNSLNTKQLNDFYKETLLDFEIDDPKRSGLGIIDMRLKSKRNFTYEFFPVDDIVSFYTLQLSIEKQDSVVIEPLNIVPTKDTPEVVLDPQKNIFQINLRSIPENAVLFYSPVIKWFEKYIESPNSLTVIDFKFDYFNTSSAKQVAKIMLLLDKLSEKSAVKIRWFYKKDDHDMLNGGMRYAQLMTTAIEFVEY